MTDIRIKPTIEAVAELAAAEAWRVLTNAIAEHGTATWVLAGGTAALAAYGVLAEKYTHRIDWSHVQFVIGDERFVPFESPDSNWGEITRRLLDPLQVPAGNRVAPRTDLPTPEDAANDYAAKLEMLPKGNFGLPRFDLVWLGVGEDGHTLSLFPGRHEAVQKSLVVAVHESPKPPADRITMTLAALTNTAACFIIATGQGKATAIGRALHDGLKLPIAQAAATITAAGGHVAWLLDDLAGGSSTVTATT